MSIRPPFKRASAPKKAVRQDAWITPAAITAVLVGAVGAAVIMNLPPGGARAGAAKPLFTNLPEETRQADASARSPAASVPA